MKDDIDIAPVQNADAPAGQQPQDDTGNNQSQGNQQADSATDFVEFEGVKVPFSAFEKIAREKYRDQFDAYDNKSKWQAENTRKAQEHAEAIRKAEAFDRLEADRFQRPAPKNEYESSREAYIAKKVKLFPDVDPRFFESQFDDIWEMSEERAKKTVEPIYAQSSEQFERDFLSKHPNVVKGSTQYYELGELIGAGVDSEKAYEFVFRDSILKEKTESAIKARDEEAKRKLQQSRQTSTSGSESSNKTRSEKIWDAINKHGGAG